MNAFELVHQLIQQGLEQGAYPSAAVAVGIGNQTFLKQTYGDCCESTLFDMASLSKILGPTMIALRFLEEGCFRLYDTVADFFPQAPSDKKDITILQLMTHTSGIPAHFFLSDHTDDTADAAEVILNHPLAQAPGNDPGANRRNASGSTGPTICIRPIRDDPYRLSPRRPRRTHRNGSRNRKIAARYRP